MLMLLLMLLMLTLNVDVFVPLLIPFISLVLEPCQQENVSAALFIPHWQS